MKVHAISVNCKRIQYHPAFTPLSPFSTQPFHPTWQSHSIIFLLNSRPDSKRWRICWCCFSFAHPTVTMIPGINFCFRFKFCCLRARIQHPPRIVPPELRPWYISKSSSKNSGLYPSIN